MNFDWLRKLFLEWFCYDMEAILHEKAGERLEIGLENSKIEINI